MNNNITLHLNQALSTIPLELRIPNTGDKIGLCRMTDGPPIE